MDFASELKAILDDAEQKSVGTSFGGNWPKGSFSVPKVRDWIVEKVRRQPQQDLLQTRSTVEDVLRTLSALLPPNTFKAVVASAVRFSFLIELTNVKVTSTKMKTRWLPGNIPVFHSETDLSETDLSETDLSESDLPESDLSVTNIFQPGNDPRSASYNECLEIFKTCCVLTHQRIVSDISTISLIDQLSRTARVSYEFPVGYINPLLSPVHRAANITWTENADLHWLVRARTIFKNATGLHSAALKEIGKTKFNVKVYKTDRSLTGKDKTNRAKRWEVLAGDFQHATLSQCWSVERKLTCDLIHFEDFPASIQEEFVRQGLIAIQQPITRCPITLAPLNYVAFEHSILNKVHGRSDYQVGHLIPLKRGGRHDGYNVCWQSADGNRIQGDLRIEEVESLLDDIARRRIERRSLGPISQ